EKQNHQATQRPPHRETNIPNGFHVKQIKTKPPERAHSVPCRGSDQPFQREERIGCDRQTHMISANVHPQHPNNTLHPNVVEIPAKGKHRKQIPSLTNKTILNPSVTP